MKYIISMCEIKFRCDSENINFLLKPITLNSKTMLDANLKFCHKFMSLLILCQPRFF